MRVNLFQTSWRTFENDTMLKHTLWILFFGIINASDSEIPNIIDLPLDRSVRETDVSFYLYTREINGTLLSAEELIKTIDASLPTVFIIHGWTSAGNDSFCTEMARAFVERQDSNAVAVDWSEVAARDYLDSAGSADDIGAVVGRVILTLKQEYGADLSNYEIAAHSLGAQVAGFVGKTVQSEGGVSLGRITAMDPAGPLFNSVWDNDSSRLSSTDADLVVVIHTDGGVSGFYRALGDIDFYPNGGVNPQPGCADTEDSNACSHNRAYELYIEAIQNDSGFISTKCIDYILYTIGLCSFSPRVAIGGQLTLRNSGTYYLRTNGEEPYSKE